jgi:hypothetical protein
LITPILHKPHADAEATEDGAEARMRQALGKLGTASPGKPEAPRRMTYQATPGAGRHRFRQDGEVPVVRLTLAPGNRSGERQSLTPVGNAGAVQGQAGEGCDHGSGENARQVQELTDQLRATQTRLGHAELAAGEAIRTAQARQEEATGLRQALGATEATLAQVRAGLAASEQAREKLEQRRHATRHPGPDADGREDTATRRKVGRPCGSTNRVRDQMPTSEPEPVKWWAED